MSAQVTVREVLEAIGEIYKSFDVRTLAVEVDGRLRNLATVVEFSRYTRDVLKCNSDSRLGSDHIRRGPVFLVRSFHNIDEWPSIVEMFGAGGIVVDGISITLFGSPNLDSLSSRIGTSDYVAKNRSSEAIFEATFSPKTTIVQIGENVSLLRSLTAIWHGNDVVLQMSQSGFSHSIEFLQSRFGFQSGVHPDPGAVHVVIPIPAAVHDCRWDPGKRELRAYALIDPELVDDVWIRGQMVFQDLGRLQEVKFGKFYPDDNPFKNPDMVYAQAEWDWVVPCDRAELRLVHNRLGIISSTSFSRFQLLPDSYANPLFAIVSRFCPRDRIRAMLTKPEVEKNDAPKVQRTYEQYVQWLLSMCGFIAITLGSHEYLHFDTSNSKVRKGSLDILAFHPGRRLVLLVSCTMNAPNEGDYSNLVDLRAALISDVGPQAGVDVDLVVFTAAEDVAPDPRYGAGDYYIAVINQATVRVIVEELENPDHPTLFRILDPPQLLADSDLPS